MLDRRQPRPERGPALRLETVLGGADPLPRLAHGQPQQAVQAERKADRRCRVVPACTKTSRQHGRDAAAVPAPVAPSSHGLDDRWPVRLCRPEDLSQPNAVAHQPDNGPGGPARRAAAAAAARARVLGRGTIRCPILDVDR